MSTKIIYLNKYKKLKEAFEDQDLTIQEIITCINNYLILDEDVNDENRNDLKEC